MEFVGEEVQVLIEKRKLYCVHVLHKTLNLVISRSCYADKLHEVFKSHSVFLFLFYFVFFGTGIAHELPLRRQVWICDDLSWWLIQRNLPGIALTPQPRPQGAFPWLWRCPPHLQSQGKRLGDEVAHPLPCMSDGLRVVLQKT